MPPPMSVAESGVTSSSAVYQNYKSLAARHKEKLTRIFIILKSMKMNMCNDAFQKLRSSTSTTLGTTEANNGRRVDDRQAKIERGC
jgi:hypothetical protein